jgi:hypothetical protein
VLIILSGGFGLIHAENEGLKTNAENLPGSNHLQTGRLEKVESVEIQLNVAGEIYEGLQERIEYSISRVGDKILLNQPLELLTVNQDAVKAAIFNVFSKVLIGFKIEKVELVIGKHTKVLTYLKPVPPYIEKVKLNLAVSGLAPELETLRDEISNRIETELNYIFTGLPVESIAWAEGIFNLVANYLLERELPGYKSQFVLKPGPETIFDIRLIPQEPVVSEVKTDINAANIPVFFVRYKTNDYREKFNVLKGLPVEFLSHYKLRIQDYLSRYANNFSSMKQTGMQVKLGIDPGIKTRVELTVDSTKYQAKFDAGYLVYNQESSVNFQGYLGYRTESYELFTRGYIIGKNPGGNIFAGCYFPLGPNFTGGFEYEFEHAYKNIGFHFQFERGDYLDLRLGIERDTPTEAIMGIYLNERFHLELIDRNNKFAVQLRYHF